jgi:hypothetical protein
LEKSTIKYADSLQQPITVAFNAIEVLLALAMASVAIAASAWSCRAVCCRKTKGTVVYTATGQPLDGVQGYPINLEQLPHYAPGQVLVPGNPFEHLPNG